MTHGNAGDAPAAARPAGVIVTDPPRAGAEHVDAVGAYGVATVHEAMGRTGCLGPGLRPVQQDVRIAGTAVTALCRPGDNLMIHAAVEQCAEGDILVVTTTSPSTDGMFGELFATALHHRGVRGLVIDAGVRDTAELRAMGFPVLVVGGQCIRPGDVILADDDGVMCVRRESAATAVEAAKARTAKEEATRAAFAEGQLGLDRYGLRETLDRLGVRYQPYAEHAAHARGGAVS
ncbi:4-carboxy-4-hydroxy-2-oxoadipate aldolase/oxaloacetate decarboxylase [Streptomyces sp. NPDC056697]|uniref:4-carboxy-4-hydroxy-2-oxoadipate aldolase/oxaloacetate decarboxylase n=1 Tax=Streptomyces sp. NPDC056697 TaxID=3345915 RepID=UPI0036AB49B1